MDTPVNTPILNRRGFLIAAAGSGVAFSFLAACETGNPNAPAYEPIRWYSIGADGIVTVNIIRAEMGQHVGTSLARILADELDAKWEDVRIAHVDTDPKWGLMVTGGSWSVWQTYPLYSQAGAAGRLALIEAGAKALGVDAASCTSGSCPATRGATRPDAARRRDAPR
jgi:CO/xanthine dehydrogenase Mo-binding subunit